MILGVHLVGMTRCGFYFCGFSSRPELAIEVSRAFINNTFAAGHHLAEVVYDAEQSDVLKTQLKPLWDKRMTFGSRSDRDRLIISALFSVD
jgi:hypothetical protein